MAALAGVGLLLAGRPAAGAQVSGAEASVFRWVNELPDVPYALPWLVMQVGNVGATAAAAALAVQRGHRPLAARLLIGGAATWVVAKLVKAVVERGRPAQVMDEVILRHAVTDGWGWVSGHAAVTAALVTIAWSSLSARWRLVVLVSVAPMYIARVYVGEHLPLDMVGGAFLGVACGQLVVATATWRVWPTARKSEQQLSSLT
jgi:undecaprenyl-diphosphatase